MNELYQARKQDILLTTNHKLPKHVPVVSNLVTWPAAYRKQKMADLYEDPDLYVRTMSSVYDDIYADCYFSVGVSPNIPAYDLLGSKTFFISSDGTTMQHKQDCKMLASDYDALIGDPVKFMVNVLAPRRYPNLNDTRENVKKLLIKVLKQIAKFRGANKALNETVKNKYNILPLRSGTTMVSPFDIIFDRLRGFQNTLVDVRRYSDKLLAATKALAPKYMAPIQKINFEYPFVGATPHAPTYLGAKNFEKFYWPTYKAMIIAIAEKGSKAMINLEGKWRSLYPLLLDMPQSSIVGIVEEDDPFEAKKLIGDRFTIISGVPTHYIKYKTKQECLDYAKKVIDELAPGGGFMFSTEKNLLSLTDVNVENYIALQEFVHEYGKY
ncbi:MAG: hypothetical protein ACOWWR_08510 [Eubacteriales bacterium]